jgi:hypothetical protein
MIETILLTSFAFGLLVTVISFAAGSFDSGDADLSDGDLGDADAGDVSADGDNGDLGDGSDAGVSWMPPVNLSTISLFAAWFGGIGYLLVHYTAISLAIALVIASAAGLFAAAALSWFIRTVFVGRGRTMRHEPMSGVVAELSAAIREGGVGEIVYLRDGARHSMPARSEDGGPLERGVEVMVVRCDEGIAFVRPLNLLLEE